MISSYYCKCLPIKNIRNSLIYLFYYQLVYCCTQTGTTFVCTLIVSLTISFQWSVKGKRFTTEKLHTSETCIISFNVGSSVYYHHGVASSWVIKWGLCILPSIFWHNCGKPPHLSLFANSFLYYFLNLQSQNTYSWKWQKCLCCSCCYTINLVVGEGICHFKILFIFFKLRK